MRPSRGTPRLRVDQGSVDDQFIGLDRPLTVIGRRQGSDVVIHDTNVSRMHAQIKRDGGTLVIEDTNSSNGTIVNDERIEQPRSCTPATSSGSATPSSCSKSRGDRRAARGLDDGDRPRIADDEPRAAPELIPGPEPGAAPAEPLTPPPAIMDRGHTAIADSLVFEDDLSPPSPRASTRHLAAPGGATPPPHPESAVAPRSAVAPSAHRPASSPPRRRRPAARRRRARLAAARAERGRQELGTFSGTLGGLADRVERLERALDAATGDLDSVADAIRGPDAAVLMELQGILADIERAGDGPQLDDAGQGARTALRRSPVTSSCCSSCLSRPAPSRVRCASTVVWWRPRRASRTSLARLTG